MDDLEFRKNATIEPDSVDQDFLLKSRQTASNRRFVKQQKQFNQQLLDTLHVRPPENLSERIILAQQLGEHQRQNQHSRHKRWRNWLGGSIAASLVIALSVHFILPETLNSTVLAQQVVEHVNEDTHALNIHMDVPKSSIDTMLASYGGKLNGPIGQVYFLGRCIIGGHTGIHMVLKTSRGLVTVFLLPTQRIDNSTLLDEGQLSGILYPSGKGSIAIVAEQPAAIEVTRLMIDDNLNWII